MLSFLLHSQPLQDCSLWIDKRNHDVTRTFGDRQTFVVMSKTSRMHQQPTFFGVRHGAIVPNESASSALVIIMSIVQRDVDGIRGAVMMRPQKKAVLLVCNAQRSSWRLLEAKLEYIFNDSF